KQPWKTLHHSLKQLKPGETLYLRGGIYYENCVLSMVGTVEKPITIRSYPGELAVIDGGLREFHEDPAHAWEPVPQGAPDEFRSTKVYTHGGGFGNFADSMVPLHRYLSLNDLRSQTEFWHSGLGKRTVDPKGIYCGPGVRRDPETGRIFVRLSHTKLLGLGKDAYGGETDPRKVPLVIAGHDYTVQIEGAKHIRLQDLVIRGGGRSAVIISEDREDITEDAEDIELDGVTLYGSDSALRTSRTKNLRVLRSVLRGHAAPWHSRSHHKYRAMGGYLAVVGGRDLEFAGCEFTDHHDCIQMYFAETIKFHHNFVDNFNDDGIELGPKKERGRMLIYQNLISRCLNPFTLHGGKANPVKNEEGSGVYICRNMVDLRQGTYKAVPAEPDPTGAFLNNHTVMVAHDHGGPTWPVYYVYHNTFIMPDSAFRGYYAFAWGSHTAGTTRRVFNNICVQVNALPGLNFSSVALNDDFEADGNLLWGVKDGPGYQGDYFEKFRKSAAFETSKKRYSPGWGANDRFADPKFLIFPGEDKQVIDFRLHQESPAIDAGVALPKEWFDPLREFDKDKPDLGAFPLGTEPFTVGPKFRPSK
ncbi:MAG: hypothetical protein K8T89_15855, partial [Planctomycetes bacterium]|nr:hypothetical protein [Planctomycetota bacterium]